MKVLGISVNHNASACLFDDEKLVYFNQEERISREKNFIGIPIHCLKEIKKITDKVDKIVITGYSRSFIKGCLSEVKTFDFDFSDFYFYQAPHHLCHAFKSFFSSNFSDALIIVWDGRGSSFYLNDGSDAYETTSVFYMSDKRELNLLYKKFHRDEPLTGKNLSPAFPEHDLYDDTNLSCKVGPNFEYEVMQRVHDLGHYYSAATTHFSFSELDCGKLMGLHSYGKKNNFLSNLICEENKFKSDLFKKDEHFVIDTEKYSFLKNESSNQNILWDFAYETQKSLEKIGLNFIQKILKKYQCKNLILTGGVSLNIVANSFYKKYLPKDINLYVDPLCADEGTSIGVAQWYLYDKFNLKPSIPDTIYLNGNIPSYEFSLLENERVFDNIDYSFVVDLLLDSNIVAIFQGRSEAGPRALGNRSILFDPRIKNGKEIVNKVKKREPFRPFACSVLLEESHKWFDMSSINESPYMMYSFDALPGVKDIIPSVIHIDNTCRIQTVTKEQNYHYYNLIKEFYTQTNVPILFNTSFNLAGDPIVETIEDALNTLRRSELEYLYLPEINQIIYVPNK